MHATYYLVKERPYYENMRAKLRALDSSLSDGAITHACNMIGNELRRATYDIHEVALSMEPFASTDGYFHDFEVSASGRTIYARVTID
jgi:hypothetical protein